MGTNMLSQKHTCRKKGIGRREEEVESRGKKTEREKEGSEATGKSEEEIEVK